MLYACFSNANTPSSSTGVPIKKLPMSRLRYVLLIPEPQDAIIIIVNEEQPRFLRERDGGDWVANSNGYYRRRFGEAEQKGGVQKNVYRQTVSFIRTKGLTIGWLSN